MDGALCLSGAQPPVYSGVLPGGRSDQQPGYLGCGGEALPEVQAGLGKVSQARRCWGQLASRSPLPSIKNGKCD